MPMPVWAKPSSRPPPSGRAASRATLPHRPSQRCPRGMPPSIARSPPICGQASARELRRHRRLGAADEHAAARDREARAVDAWSGVRRPRRRAHRLRRRRPDLQRQRRRRPDQRRPHRPEPRGDRRGLRLRLGHLGRQQPDPRQRPRRLDHQPRGDQPARRQRRRRLPGQARRRRGLLQRPPRLRQPGRHRGHRHGQRGRHRRRRQLRKSWLEGQPGKSHLLQITAQ